MKKIKNLLIVMLSIFMIGCNNTKIDNTNTDQKDISEKSQISNNVEKSTKDENKKNDNGLKEKVIDYILNGQGDKPDATKMLWNEEFLNKVDIDPLYKQYIENGGTPDDLKDFSLYITLNAPIPSDWEKMFEDNLYKTYGEKVVRLEHLEDVLYQAYINHDGTETPYVVVSSRTGYFHG